MPKVTLQLTTPLKTVKGEVHELTFREPRFGDVMLLGEPTAPLLIGGDRLLPSPIPEVVGNYAERLLECDKPVALEMLNLRDTMALQRIILGFFEEAARPEKSDASDANSPSTGGAPTMPASAG